MSPKRRLASPRGNGGERGFVLVTVAASAFALVVVIGLSVDIGRMYISKNETQAYVDAASLAAAMKLDGTTAGITAAQAAVASTANTWNFDTTAVPAPTVTFATSSAGPWVASPSPATTYTHVRVLATVAQPLYFIPVAVPKYSQNVASFAISGQIPLSSLPRGLAPYTAVTVNDVGPNFGLNIGDSYDIQWPQFNDTRAGCGPGNPDKCFNQPPCDGDSKEVKQAVAAYWGTDNNGYWGDNSNQIIRQEILDLIQVAPIDIGYNMDPVLTNGNKASQAGYLDERASQDLNTTDNTVAAYMASTHNGRRLIPVPIVHPRSTTETDVVGYGAFLLLANGPGTSNYYTRNTNGNEPFCAIYAGTYLVGGASAGVPSPTGAARIKLVQ